MGLLGDTCNNRARKDGILFDGVYSKRNVHNISEIWAFVAIGFILLLGYVAHHSLYDNLPKALGNSDLLHNSNSFITERAIKDLKILTSFGPRPTGSYANEKLAVDFLKREISFIKQTAHKSQRIEMDMQLVSGSFFADFKPRPMTSLYRSVQNVVVKLHGEPIAAGVSNNSLLLNCHFDTVPGSPGASDDAASCIVMLEILRVFSRNTSRNRHSIVFLFNGAEETGLQAAHGFITQHKWAKDIRAFINLESVGSGGKELLFQTSSNNEWLLKLYGKAAPHPFALVAAEEIFQSGLIPSDTDFRIFRDFGHIPGLDFAHIVNGYKYHTKFDHMDYIPRETIQHTGDNIVQLTKYIANSHELAKNHKHEKSSQVYFDLFGLYFVSYSADVGVIANYIIVVCAVIIPYALLSKATKGINKKHLRFEIFLGFLINMISLVASNALCYAFAYDLDLMGKSMTWYSNNFLCVPTYCLATVFIQSVCHLIFNRNSKTPLSLALQTQARLIGTCFFWSILTAALTGAGIRTAYAIVVPLLVTLLTNVIIGIFDFHNTIRKWLYIHLAGQVFVVLWALHYYHLVVGVFIPTAGRSGGQKNPDIMIAIVCSSLTFFATSYVTPLVNLFKKSSNYLIVLFATYVITRFYFIAFTHYGFPYEDDRAGAPKIQRHYITHTVRTLYDKEGNIRYTDSGYWMLEMDRNARKTIESLTMPEEPIPQDSNILCKNEVFCGLPLLSIRQLSAGGFWVPGPPPLLRDVADLKFLSQEKTDSTMHRLSFLLTGSYMMSVQIRLKDSVQLKNWSISSTVPPQSTYNKHKAYFIMISHGLEAEPLQITLDLKTASEDHKRAFLDITVVTCHLEYHKEHTSVFANLLAKLPSWAYAVPSVASLKSWTF